MHTSFVLNDYFKQGGNRNLMHNYSISMTSRYRELLMLTKN